MPVKTVVPQFLGAPTKNSVDITVEIITTMTNTKSLQEWLGKSTEF